MPRSEPFEVHADRYDRWFDDHELDYRAELAALEPLVPSDAVGLEVGVGTGRFAAPLGVETGLDPARSALDRARGRGIDTVRGVGEQLPFAPESFDVVLLVTTVCFLDDLEATFLEAHRVLSHAGRLVCGYIDRESPLGQQYVAGGAANPFYEAATFHSTDELRAALDRTGFAVGRQVQTLFETGDRHAVREGTGPGSFVGLAATPARP